jgi:hypothetical protein
MKVSRYRQLAVADRFIWEIAAVDLKAHEATEFIFDVGRVPVLKNAAHPDVLTWTDATFRKGE